MVIKCMEFDIHVQLNYWYVNLITGFKKKQLLVKGDTGAHDEANCFLTLTMERANPEGLQRWKCIN